MISIEDIFLIFGGITISVGSLNLALGLSKRGERSYLLFGIFSIFASLFFFTQKVVPLSGGISSGAGLLAIIFAAIYFIAFIWYIGEFTHYRKLPIQLLLSGSIVVALLLFVFRGWKDPDDLLWDAVANVAIVGIGIYGIVASIKGKYPGSKLWHRLFTGFMVILILLSINQGLNNLFQIKVFEGFYQGYIPMDLFPVLFVIVMGSKMTNDIFRRRLLEHQLDERERKWAGLMDNIELMIVELDKNGSVLFVNPFFTRVTGYQPKEILRKDWFQTVIPKDQSNTVQSVFKELINKKETSGYLNPILAKDGKEIILEWKNISFHDSKDDSDSIISIGLDITQQQKSYEEINRLKNQLEKENLLLKEEISNQGMITDIIGVSSAIQYTIQRSLQVSKTDSSVLLEGETGSGKELFANLIHKKSKRSSKPIVKVNCAALPKELIESELFGHEKGSFTGAHKNREGRFEMANNGTIFLDEIGELPIELQPKLLRVLQDGTFEPIGSDHTKKVNIRLIAATNRDLNKDVKEGKFREDLFYRLNVYPITVPPLRQRKEDIPMLVRHFVNEIGVRIGRSTQNISKADLEKLQQYDWPGNVRELENVIERALINSNGDTLTIELPTKSGNTEPNYIPNKESRSLEDHQKELILETLESCEWKINGEDGAAARLDMHPSTLRSKMKKLDINRSENQTK